MYFFFIFQNLLTMRDIIYEQPLSHILNMSLVLGYLYQFGVAGILRVQQPPYIKSVAPFEI